MIGTNRKKFTYSVNLVRRHADGSPVVNLNGSFARAEIATDSPAKLAAFVNAGGDWRNLKRAK